MEANLEEDKDKRKFINEMTRKAFQQMVMPPVGTKFEDGSEVEYVNFGQMRFTAVTDNIPLMGAFLEMKDMVYEVCHLRPEKNRFSARFVGFKQPTKRPEEDTGNTAKLLDDEE